MGTVINLRLARKAKKRSDHAKQAEANRALHGRTKSERVADEATQARLDRTLDGARRDADSRD